MSVPGLPPTETSPPAPIAEPPQVQWIRGLALAGGGISIVLAGVAGMITGGCCILWIFHLAIGVYGLIAGIEAQSRRSLPPGHLAALYILCVLTLDVFTFACGLVMGFLQRSPVVLDWRYRVALRDSGGGSEG